MDCVTDASVSRGNGWGISAVEEGQRAGRGKVEKRTAAGSRGAGTRIGGGGVEGVTSAWGKVAEHGVAWEKFLVDPGH